jgi:phenylacetate-CoA ligase
MLRTALYWSLRRAVRGGDAATHAQLIRERPPAELNAQFLVSLLRFCQGNNPYYRRLLSGKAISVHALQELPSLTKDMIRRNFDELKSEGLPLKPYLNSSGGSTGSPQTFLQDHVYEDWSWATESCYFRESHGISPDSMRKVVLWGSERDTFKQRNLRGTVSNWLTKTLFLNTFNVPEQDWLRYVEAINRYHPYFIKGYAGSLYELARVINRLQLAVHQPRFVYSSAEMLRDFMRREIEMAFRAKAYDFYGSREVGPIAGECREGRRHIFVYNNHVEVVDASDSALPEGEVGRILVTNLHNYSMPLLRYEIGDTGSLSSATCPCGSPLPHLVELKGRISDHFKRSDGTLIHGEYFTHLFYFRPWVKEFQVNQLAYDHVQICVVREAEAQPADIEDVETKVRLVMGQDCRVTWEYVPSIPRTSQGKQLFTRSLVQ